MWVATYVWVFYLRDSLSCACTASGPGWVGVGAGVDALSHFKVNYVDTVSSSYFFLFAALFQTSGHAHTPHSCPHTHIHTACIKNSCHTRRYKDAHGSGGKAAAVDKWGVWEGAAGGKGGRTTGCERASNRSAAKLLKLIKFRLCQHCAYAPYALPAPTPDFLCALALRGGAHCATFQFFKWHLPDFYRCLIFSNHSDIHMATPLQTPTLCSRGGNVVETAEI